MNTQNTFSRVEEPAVASIIPSFIRDRRQYVPGLLSVLGLACLAQFLGEMFPIVGGPIFGLVLGLAVRWVFGLDLALATGVRFSSKKILQLSIVLFGGSLSLTQIWQTGRESLGIMLASLVAGLVAALVLGKWLKIPWRLAGLVGSGTSICGASAIAAVAPAIDADKDEIAYSVSTIFLFNIIAVFAFPVFGHLVALTDQQFGVWAGTAINDTSSVVAAGFSWSLEAGSYATVVKLARSTMILPVALGFALFAILLKRRAGEGGASSSLKWWRIVPWFILFFIAMACFNTIGLFGPAEEQFKWASVFGITMALAAIGLSSDFSRMRKTGFRPLVLGMMTWLIVALVSLSIILIN